MKTSFEPNSASAAPAQLELTPAKDAGNWEDAQDFDDIEDDTPFGDDFEDDDESGIPV